LPLSGTVETQHHRLLFLRSNTDLPKLIGPNVAAHYKRAPASERRSGCGNATGGANHHSVFACAERWARSRSARLLSIWTIARQAQRPPKIMENRDASERLVVVNRSSSRHGGILRFLMTQARQALSLQSRVRKKRCSADLPS
jgi:hypothetical protein